MLDCALAALQMEVLGGRHQGRQELTGLDGVGKGRKRVEGAELAPQQCQTLALGRKDPKGLRSAFGHLPKQLQTGAVREPLARDEDFVLGFAEQVDAIGLVGQYVDRELPGQRPHERFQHGGILIDDEDPHDAD